MSEQTPDQRIATDLARIVEDLVRRVDAACAEICDQASGRTVAEVVREAVFPFEEDGDAYVMQFHPHEVWARCSGIRYVFRGVRFRITLELPRTAPSHAARVQGEIEACLPRLERALGGRTPSSTEQPGGGDR